jgi:hypothetical protein
LKRRLRWGITIPARKASAGFADSAHAGKINQKFQALDGHFDGWAEQNHMIY